MKVRQFSIIVAVLSAGVAAQAAGMAGDQNWDSRFGLAPGFDGRVRALAAVGTNLYVAGDFTRIGDLGVSRVARWDGTQWYALGSGIEGLFPSVRCLASDGTNLFAGGSFFSAGGIAATNIARWDGQAWAGLGDGLGWEGGWGGVASLAVRNSKLYVGGTFNVVGGLAATNIAVWDGVQWAALGDGLQGL